MQKIVALLFVLSVCSLAIAQDTLYTNNDILLNVKIRDLKPDFVEYRLPDDTKENHFIDMPYVNAIVLPGGFHQIVRHEGTKSFFDYYFVCNNGDTVKVDLQYDPARKFELDSGIKLCRFSDDAEYTRLYGDRKHFYLNDPDKKFYSAQKVFYWGMNMSFMKLINAHDLPKVSMIKNKYLKEISEGVNEKKAIVPIELGSKIKEVLDQQFSEKSYLLLDSFSWIGVDDYALDARKLPAIIKSLAFPEKEGVGLLFVVEKFSKPDKAVSGYWVAFNMADKQILLMDYIVCKAAGSGGIGWVSYWLTPLMLNAVSEPYSFYKYQDLVKKGKLQLTCE